MTATGTGFMIPEPPLVPANAGVVEHTADATLTVASFARIHTNTGAGAAKNLTLPSAADAAGMSIKIQITAAWALVLIPASTEKIYLGGDGVADSTLTIAGVIGNYADVYCDGKRYHVIDYNGVLTKS
jgi:hypothetical protein